MEQMEQEISLREIIEIILSGKWLIAGITAIAVLVSGIVSFFILDPVYEARATLNITDNREEGNPNYLVKYVEQVTSHAVMTDTLNSLGIDREELSITGLREKISTEIVENTPLIRIKVTDSDPELASIITNQIAASFIYYMRMQEQEELRSLARSEVEKIEAELEIHRATLAKLEEELKNTPEFILTQKSLAGDSYLHAIESERRRAAEAGGLQLLDEEINPVYTSLQQSITDLRVEMKKLEARKEELIQRIEETGFISSQHIIITSPAIPPERPIAPKKALNIAIAGVVGLMVSVFIVFFRHYWQTTSPSGTMAPDRRIDQNQGLPM